MNSRAALDGTTVAFDGLSAPRRRYLLSVLYDRQEPTSLETLATEVAVREHASPIVTDEQVRTAHVELVHNHVPRLLEDELLVEEPTTDGTRRIALAERSLFDADWVTFLLENPTGGRDWEEQRVNRTLETLGPARRREICRVLARHPDGFAVADLAAILAARSEETRLVDVDESVRAPVETQLVHDDLPALENAGLVAYDRADGTASIETDAAQWRAEWLAQGPLADVCSLLCGDRSERDDIDGESEPADDSPSEGACRTLEGTETVVAKNCEIADSAEEELVVTVPDAGLLERRCLERWRAAADRGVDVYVGSRSPRVRDTVRSAVPGATICEPQCDWLNFPAGRVNHGHVVFADRERVLLVTRADEPSAPTGTAAITGDGSENALVRLVREHVGPRLDRLQSRCADELPDAESAPLPL
ncbi:hypothetical protein C477_21820 [Haloterrigena salina JCM 13891]|uniref:DUF7344 domain-containing protein n=1 Tax=Haloterrigena salina JCM 13891 TaxID=1227488 RepID=M0BSQ7_9EURY|nr:hypothetical protein [Haloterrigena salina]ELZ13142.1 hypothetical protein C477_21820 [Haloterrigena salina JCM 13891]